MMTGRLPTSRSEPPSEVISKLRVDSTTAGARPDVCVVNVTAGARLPHQLPVTPPSVVLKTTGQLISTRPFVGGYTAVFTFDTSYGKSRHVPVMQTPASPHASPFCALSATNEHPPSPRHTPGARHAGAGAHRYGVP